MNKMKISEIEFEGIDFKDYPDFCDAHIVRATYEGVEMTEDQLEVLNGDMELVAELLFNYLH